MKYFQTEFELEVVKSFLAGEGGAKLLARRWSLPEEKIRWNGIGATSVCNDDISTLTMASLSTQWAYENVYSPEKQWIGRGWFNLRPKECMNIDNLMKIGGTAVLFITIGGKVMSFPISASYDWSVTLGSLALGAGIRPCVSAMEPRSGTSKQTTQV